MQQKQTRPAVPSTFSPNQIKAVKVLLDSGATIPFIARYRKEATGSLDEVQVALIRDQLEEEVVLNKRRQAILDSLTERDLLSPELEKGINTATTLCNLEDIYLPYRQKRKTRAGIARDNGLEPIAQIIFKDQNQIPPLASCINKETGYTNEGEVLSGCRDIIAEWISEHGKARSRLRELFARQAVATSRVVEKNKEQGNKYRDYFDREEPIRKLAGHRLLAMLRGEQEKVLRLSIRPQEEHGIRTLEHIFVRSDLPAGRQVREAVLDSYKRLLAPSLENELRTALKERADKEAIDVFGDNLHQLLLASPLGRKSVMALDPGFRTGAKLTCLDALGNLLHHTTIYPLLSEAKKQQAAQEVVRLCTKHGIEAIAVGNGTAGRETEAFLREIDLPAGVIITMVDESGASIYSASEIAREEFPDYDITVRGAVSIGRRLQDPLAELVKLDPKSIGVGQYQHDVNQKALKKGLDDVVIRCVNKVGIDVNTASESLLTYVSGLGSVLAKHIVLYRKENGPFTSRAQLLKVPRLGPKAYEQCAGFLRIRNARNPLDNTGVHPENYNLLKTIARDLDCNLERLISEPELRARIASEKYTSAEIGIPTLKDIVQELEKPGRDPRKSFSAFAFADDIRTIDDLETDMLLPGIVTNVTNFGAFVDIGVHQDGLVHISQLADRFVDRPGDVVKVRQQVRVRVLDVDTKGKRISLSMRKIPQG